jgi:nicotinamide riboside transporter PnuC
MWSWVLAVIGVTGIYFVGRKTIWGWIVLCFNEVLWITYALITKQYGFIFSAIAYAAVYIKSYIHWKREESEDDEVYNEIYTHGHIDHRYIK